MVLGVTGHQNLQDVNYAREAVRGRITSLNPSSGLTSLAGGADQVFAELCIELGIPFTAVVPAADYIKTFDTDVERRNYRQLREQATNVVSMPFIEASSEAFLEAGKWIVDNADALIAVWDGKPSQGVGGTADVVAYAKQKGKAVHVVLQSRDG